MRAVSEVFGRRSLAVAPSSRPKKPCAGCGKGCRDCVECVEHEEASEPADVLFLSRQNTGHKGLGWNAWHSCNALATQGIVARAMQLAPDSIAAVVRKAVPRVVVLMAFWVPAATIDRLAVEFPDTVFLVKNHSGPQFLAQEGTGWSSLLAVADLARRRPNVRLAAIKGECVDGLKALGVDAVELPNVYSPEALTLQSPARLPGFHVGIFGAYRSLKNAVGMAFAVALAAERGGERITLHVNGSRTECGSVSDAAVIPEFCRRAGVRFVAHGWLDHEPFKRLAGSMTVALQASFSETYNYVAADCVTAGTPVVGSDAIYWLPPAWRVNPDSTEAIARAVLAARTWDVGEGLDALQADNTAALGRLVDSLRGLGVGVQGR